MIKQTKYFGNPCYLSLGDGQMVLRLPEVDKNDNLTEQFKKEAFKTFPIEDIGIVILDHKQITITNALIEALMENNVALVTCDSTHHPFGLMLPLHSNKIQNARYRAQLDASEPLKKQLWQQTVIQKIKNQAASLETFGIDNSYLVPLYKNVKSGDTDNCEATAAAFYWGTVFSDIPEFRRFREGLPPNNYLNYGYALLRATMARSIVGAGLLPTLGIHHANKYNAYCLADDLMEPYRAYVDIEVKKLLRQHGTNEDIPKEIKQELLKIPAMDVMIDGEKSPLMVGMQRTAVSLVKCFEGEQRKILYPEL
jgi:CRISPR-associated protein Cas1